MRSRCTIRRPAIRATSRALARCLACPLAGLALAPSSPTAGFLVKAALYVAYLAAVWNLGVLATDERAEIRGMLASLRGAMRRPARESLDA